MMHSEERQTDELWVRVSGEPLHIGEVEPWLHDERAGGICLFVGTTRRYTGDVVTEELRYEAFGEMAVLEMQRLARDACSRWPLIRVALHHRVGSVLPAESSVLVGVSAPHRAAAFDACRFLIDTLKESVPVWKKEVRGDGTTSWVEPGVEGSRG